MNIRLETPQDYRAVEDLTYAAFRNMQKPGRGACDEHFLVHKMRDVEAFIPELAYVAEVDGRIAGNIMYTKSMVVDDAGVAYETLTFGPLSVLPENQGQGIGAALIRHTLDKARKLGYRAVLITGHPAYYPKFGFVNAEQYGITLPDGSNMDAFMALALYEGALSGIHGKWRYDSVFEIDSDERRAFNEKYGYA